MRERIIGIIDIEYLFQERRKREMALKIAFIQATGRGRGVDLEDETVIVLARAFPLNTKEIEDKLIQMLKSANSLQKVLTPTLAKTFLGLEQN